MELPRRHRCEVAEAPAVDGATWPLPDPPQHAPRRLRCRHALESPRWPPHHAGHVVNLTAPTGRRTSPDATCGSSPPIPCPAGSRRPAAPPPAGRGDLTQRGARWAAVVCSVRRGSRRISVVGVWVGRGERGDRYGNPRVDIEGAARHTHSITLWEYSPQLNDSPDKKSVLVAALRKRPRSILQGLAVPFAPPNRRRE
ncbi:hypothetical protein E2C01_055249 [Portunus trituberculatus]|uniref:Uncharacterized protein n=1 Tax=Portunus trituberculatus TaxID=210409 RepID=A0A5B7GUS2_PORTR|nr:hypothetical protein [Portunus trituberculatus]